MEFACKPYTQIPSPFPWTCVNKKWFYWSDFGKKNKRVTHKRSVFHHAGYGCDGEHHLRLDFFMELQTASNSIFLEILCFIVRFAGVASKQQISKVSLSQSKQRWSTTTVENRQGQFFRKLQKIWKKYKKWPAKGAREARPFVAKAFVLVLSRKLLQFYQKLQKSAKTASSTKGRASRGPSASLFSYFCNFW